MNMRWLGLGLLAAVSLSCGAKTPSTEGQQNASAHETPAPLTVMLTNISAPENASPTHTRISLRFSHPVSRARVRALLEISPPVELDDTEDELTYGMSFHGEFAEQTKYHVRLSPGVVGDDGRRVEREAVEEFTTGRFEPRVSVPGYMPTLPPGRPLPIEIAHVRDVRARVIPLRFEELSTAVPLIGVWSQPNRPLTLPQGWQERARTLQIPNPENRRESVSRAVDVFADGDSGLALIIIDGAEAGPPRVLLAQRATLSILWKQSDHDGLVWVTDVATGEPVANARVNAWSADRKRWEGRTDAQGLVRLPARSVISPPPARLRNDDEYEEGDYYDEDEGAEQIFLRQAHVRVEHAGHVGFALASFNNRSAQWAFDVPLAYGDNSTMFAAATERGIYRPGEEVHLFGTARKRKLDGHLVAFRGPVKVRITGPEGEEIINRDLRPSQYGTYELTLPLGNGARLGSYGVQVRAANGGESGATSDWLSFDVAEYRAPNFEIVMPRVTDVGTLVPSFDVDFDARYFYGSPVPGAQTTWNALVAGHAQSFSSEALAFFEFGNSASRARMSLNDGTLTLNAQGHGRINVTTEALQNALKEQQLVDVVTEVTVTGAGEEQVSASNVRRFSRNNVLVGVRTNQWCAAASDGWNVNVVAVNKDGALVSGEPLQLQLYREHWVTTPYEDEKHRIRYNSSHLTTLVSTQTVTSASTPVQVHLDTNVGGGEYTVRVSRQGSEAYASTGIWVYGGESWGEAREDSIMKVMADRRDYEVGQTARIVAASPFARAKALVTTEREGVLTARVVDIEGGSTPIDVRIEDRHLPNVFVSVTAVPRDLAPNQHSVSAPFRIGYVNLPVDAKSRRLSVEVAPQQTEIEPGSETQVLVKIRDSAGRPVRGEVTLWAVDEAVLRLTGYDMPDFFTPMYANVGLAVTTMSSLDHWTFDPDLGSSGSDAGGLQNTALRSRFLTTAFFTKTVTTARNGEARVTFHAPDNLTRWRVMASVNDGTDRFGRGQSAVVSRKRLMLTAGLPRTMVVNDLARVSFIVQDDTGVAAPAELSIETEGASIEGDTPHSVDVSGTGQREVFVNVRATRLGDAIFRVRARKGSFSDGVELRVPVRAPTHEVRDAIASGEIDGTRTFDFTVPGDANRESTMVELAISPSPLAFLQGGLQSLVHYPYGCAEQKTSALLPLLELESLGRTLGEHLDIDRAHIQASIDALVRHQTTAGGFALWQGSSDADHFITYYVLWGLQSALAHGYQVDQSVIDRAWTWIDNTPSTQDRTVFGDWNANSRRVYDLYVRAQAGRFDDAKIAVVAAQRENLGIYDTALMTIVIAKRGHDLTPWIEQLSHYIVRNDDGSMTVRQNRKALFWDTYADVVPTSAAILAYVNAQRTTEADALVAGLIKQRTDDGTWGYTHNDAWALMALSSYAKASQRTLNNVQASVRVDGRTVGAPVRFTSTLAMQRVQLDANTLGLSNAGTASKHIEIAATGGTRLRFAAQNRYNVALDRAQAESHGLRIERHVVDAQTGEEVTAPRVGQILRIKLRVHADGDLSQIAVTDPIPGAFEPIDTNLQTERQYTLNDNGRWYWDNRELHDDRASFFASWLYRGQADVSYLVRVTRSGTFTVPATYAHGMYDPTIHARRSVEQINVSAR